MNPTTDNDPLRSVRTTFDGIQVLRAVAAIAVVFHHALEESLPMIAPGGVAPGTPLHSLVLVGASGVDLFFVISGFIMLQTNWHRFGRDNAGRFFLKRRFLRIAPLYWAMLLLVIAAHQFGWFRNVDMSPLAVAGSFLLLPVAHMLIGVAWTLVYEVYFYYVFAAWLHCGRRSIAVTGIAGSLVVLLLFANFAGARWPAQEFFANPIALEFLFGMAIAYLYRRGRLSSNHSLAYLVFALLIIVGCAMVFGTAHTGGLEGSIRWFAWGLPCAFIVASMLGYEKSKSAISRATMQLGDASYAVYLFHALLMTAYARALKNDVFAHALAPGVLVLMASSASILLGWVVHMAVEKPAVAVVDRSSTAIAGALR